METTETENHTTMNGDNEIIDVPEEMESSGLPLAKASPPQPMPLAPVAKPAVTAAQAKIEAVAQLTAKAYERASMLVLTPEESAALQQPFADSDFLPGAAGKENLIYVQHSALRDRLNKVLGLGQWAIIPRSRWNEDYRTNRGEDASRVYVEAMLLIRGAFVAEAVGDMTYHKNNASQNYGDAVEGAKTAAFRRCAKELGVGLQAWDKTWCEGWWSRKHQRVAFKPEHAPEETATVPQTPQPTPPPQNPSRPAAQPTGDKAAVTVVRLSKKEGKSAKTGKPWTLHGVLMLFASDGKERWANTFSDTVAQAAEVLIGQPALATTAPGRGDSLDLISIEPAQDDIPM